MAGSSKVGVGAFDASAYVVDGVPDKGRARQLQKARAAVEYFGREVDAAEAGLNRTLDKGQKLRGQVAAAKVEADQAKSALADAGGRLADAQRQLAKLESGDQS